ncbi:MAG TPA: PilZ domain-containing protein [bacterium]|nr:PilZ domain-containing protein [bacterium]
MKKEKRQFPRVTVKLPIRITPEFFGKVVDLSETGLRFVLDKPLPLSKSQAKIEISPKETIETAFKVIWDRRLVQQRKFTYGICFIRFKKRDLDVLKGALTKPKVKFISQPYNVPCVEMSGVDFTIGCEYGCVYCHFSKTQEKINRIWSGRCVDISPIYKMKKFPSFIYLSPFSEPFAPKAKDLAHEFLSFLLPKGINFWILTKGIIPRKTIDLIKKFSSQVEIAVGITSLDEKRNSILEPYCPSVQERFSNLVALGKTGCRLGVRMDPLIPGVDDSPETLKTIIRKIARLKIPVIIIATYLFVPASSLRRLKKIPLLQNPLKSFTEKAPTTEGTVLSTPLKDKMAKYDELNSICKSFGFKLHVCGCKDIRLKSKKVEYSLVCL